MHVGRESQTATLLTDGEVLVAGGLNEGGGSGFPTTYASAELYNPTFGTWSVTSSMDRARSGHTATLLNSGWVLVTGGGTSSSEIYEPGPAVWVPTGSLSTARSGQGAALLGNGDVLVAGGTEPGVGSPLATAEVYQAGVGPLVSLSAETLSMPTQEVGTTGNTQSFTVTNYGNAPLHVAGVETSGADPSDFAATSGCRAQPVAPGSSCTVLVRFSPLHPGVRTATVGVVDDAPLSPQGVSVSGNAAGPDVWVPTGSMSAPRTDFSATTLTDGRILMAGGENMGVSVNTAEIYDPASGSFVPTGSLGVARAFPATVRLRDGSVLAAGGLLTNGSQPTVLSSAEIYNPAKGTWSPTTPMNVASDGLTATLLQNGLVLVTGFFGSTPELYDPSSATWTDTGPLPTSGQNGLVATLHSGKVLMAGVPNGASALYDPSTNTWSATGSLGTARYAGSATVLPDGDVLAVGGLPGNGGNALSSAELYHPATGSWTATGSLPAPRYDQSAVLLPNGTVLLAGGCTTTCQSGPAQNATYLYANGFWSQTGSLPFARIGQQAGVLPDGDVLLAGGDLSGGFAATTTAERYIPTLISATPSQAAPGQQITLTGNGFYAHEQVVVTLNGRVLARPAADVRGQFAVVVTVPALAPGTYSLDAQGGTSFAFAASTFVVTASTGTPPLSP
jgi:N-acetylneuraminic acid mutarotase